MHPTTELSLNSSVSSLSPPMADRINHTFASRKRDLIQVERVSQCEWTTLAAGGADTLEKIARVMRSGGGGAARAGGGGGSRGIGVGASVFPDAAATVATLRHVHGVVVNNAVGVFRLPPRLTDHAVDMDREQRSPSSSSTPSSTPSSTLAPRAGSSTDSPVRFK